MEPVKRNSWSGPTATPRILSGITGFFKRPKNKLAGACPRIRLVGAGWVGQAPGMDGGAHAEQRRVFALAAWILRIGLGGWFVGSGVWTLCYTGLDKFTEQINHYQLVLDFRVFEISFVKGPWDAVAAYSVPWVEIVAGLLLACGVWRRPVLLVFAGLVGVFAFCIGWAWNHNLNIACGCHGGDEPINYWAKTAEFAGYYLAFGLLWWHTMLGNGPAAG